MLCSSSAWLLDGKKVTWRSAGREGGREGKEEAPPAEMEEPGEGPVCAFTGALSIKTNKRKKFLTGSLGMMAHEIQFCIFNSCGQKRT